MTVVTKRRALTWLLPLVQASHPLPTLAVTTMTTVLIAGAGNSARTCVVGAVAVLAGQLSIGWSNDAIDSRRDLATGRSDKPVALGTLSPHVVAMAAVVAAVVTVPASLALGWRSGVVHLVGVSCGWLYNVALKSTWLSAVPFAIAFGGLPAVATLALPSHPWPPWWALVAGALIGVSAHLGNVLPDIADDAATGVRGLPHRIGPWATAVCGISAAVLACLLAALAPAGSPSRWALAGLALAFVTAVAGLIRVRRQATSEAAFHVTMAVAAIGVTLLAASPAFP